MFALFFLTNSRFFRYAVIPHYSANYGFLILFTNARFFFAVDQTSNIRVLPHTVPLVTHCFLMFANFLFFCQTQIFFFVRLRIYFFTAHRSCLQVCFFDERRFFFRTTTNTLFYRTPLMFAGFVFLTNARFFFVLGYTVHIYTCLTAYRFFNYFFFTANRPVSYGFFFRSDFIC